MRLRVQKEGDSLHEYTQIIDSLRHDFWPSHAKNRKRIMEELKRGIDSASDAHVLQEQTEAYKKVKGTKVNGPTWYAVAKCDNCAGMQITSSSVTKKARWECVTCGDVCDIAWVEDHGRIKAIESLDDSFTVRAQAVRKERSGWEVKAMKSHATSVKKAGCKVGATCEWCLEREMTDA